MPRSAEIDSHEAQGGATPTRRQALVDAATQIFADRGYESATTREIAARAGCAEGLIHRYFGGKAGLLAAVMMQHSKAFGKWTPELRPERFQDELVQLLLDLVDRMWEQRNTVRVTVAQTITDPEMGRTIHYGAQEEWIAFFIEILERRQREGIIDADADLKATAHLIAAMAWHLGLFSRIVWELDRDHVQRLAEECVDTLCRGILADGHPNTIARSEALLEPST